MSDAANTFGSEMAKPDRLALATTFVAALAAGVLGELALDLPWNGPNTPTGSDSN